MFRGGLQSGAGLGDVLRGLLRFLLPVALRGIGSFAGNMLTGTQAGLPLSAAAKAALTPAMTAAAGPAAARFISNVLPGIAGGVTATAKESPASAPAAPQGVVTPQKEAVCCSMVWTVFQQQTRPSKSIKGSTQTVHQP